MKKRWPTVVRKDGSLISEMKRIEKILAMFEGLKDYDYSGLSPEKKLKLYGLLQQIPRLFSASVARLDEYAVAIDAEFSKKRTGLR